MSLPVRNLDDRTFQQLVDEAKRRIPELCPEWTNHNVSDPGVALIELFAWMTEMAIFRLNQVPDVFYTRMLNLLGFEQFPAKAARADLTFWLTSDTPQSILIPAGTEVGTVGTLGDERVFTTMHDVVVAQPRLVGALTQATKNGSYQNVWEDLRLGLRPVTVFPGRRPQQDACLYLGFQDSLAGYAVNLAITADLQGVGVVPEAPPVAWEVWNGVAWVAADVPARNRVGQPADTTGGLNRTGTLLLLIPKVHQPLTLMDVHAHWLRVRLLKDATDAPPGTDRRRRDAVYDTSPQLRGVAAATVGGIARAEHSVRVRDELLGTSNGRPGQVFSLQHRPVLPRDRHGEPGTVRVVHATTSTDVTSTAEPDERVVVITTAGRTEWTEVEDFATSTPTSTHYVLDSTTGEVRFGPRIRYPDGTSRQHGAIPPDRARIVMGSYRYGGGTAGNVGPGVLRGLREAIPYVAAVTNLGPATGGVDAERVDEAKLRGPQWFRSGERAVTASDFERVAREADPGVARVRCAPPIEAGDPVRVLIVPKVEQLDRRLHIDDLDLSETLFRHVQQRLDECRILGSVMVIGTPYYQGVSVAAVVNPEPGRLPDVVRNRVEAELYRYIDPLRGGPYGTGWAFDTDLNVANLTALVEDIDGVKNVEDITLFEYDVRRDQRLATGRDVVRLDPDSLFLSGRHRVVVR